MESLLSAICGQSLYNVQAVQRNHVVMKNLAWCLRGSCLYWVEMLHSVLYDEYSEIFKGVRKYSFTVGYFFLQGIWYFG